MNNGQCSQSNNYGNSVNDVGLGVILNRAFQELSGSSPPISGIFILFNNEHLFSIHLILINLSD